MGGMTARAGALGLMPGRPQAGMICTEAGGTYKIAGGKMKSLIKKQAKLAGAAAVLAFSVMTARAGSMEKEAAGADFGRQAAELSLAARAAHAGRAADKALNMNELLDLLRDSDPAVRKAAVRASRYLIANSRVYERLAELMQDRGEEPAIRVEAARMLSYTAQNNRVQDALADTARSGAETPELRAMAYKALWGAAGDSRVEAFLIDSVRGEKEPVLRRAAVWALFPATLNNRAREFLVSTLVYGKEDEATKIEALKSLYSGMNHHEVQDVVMGLARDNSEAKPVRLAALLTLSGAAGYSRVQDFLEAVLRGEKDPDLRAAALEASSPTLQRVREYFHLSYPMQAGGYINPIERE